MFSKVLITRQRLLCQRFHLVPTLCNYHAQSYLSHFIHNTRKPNISIISNNNFNKLLPKYYSSSRGDRNDRSDGNEDSKKPEDDEKEKFKTMVTKSLITAVLLYVGITAYEANKSKPDRYRSVSWNEFVYHMLSKGEVSNVLIFTDMDSVMVTLHPGAIVKGKKILSRTYFVSVNDVAKFEDKLREAENRLGIKDGVPVVYSRSMSWAKYIPPLILMGIIYYSFLRNPSLKSSFNMQSLGDYTHVDWYKNDLIKKILKTQIGRAKFTLIDPLKRKDKGVRFADVAGLTQAKLEVMEFVDYLRTPERYQKLGAKIPTGALLLGPPGCGKTLLAKAVATESSVPFLSMNGSEFVEMLGGLGAARVRDLFKEARKRAPCIIYIDEIDAIGKKRSFSGFDNSESEQTLNQLLVEMDGMSSRNDVIILASTNREDVLDKALLRPGRFDRHILIDLPDMEERKQIFEVHLKSIVLNRPLTQYSDRLAHLTPGFSGADIANVCNEAALHAASSIKKRVGKLDLEYAVERCMGGTEKRSHALSPQEKRVVAFHESGRAIVSWMLKHTDALIKISIIPRTNLSLGFAQYMPTDQKLYSKEQLFERMCVMMGGRVAEAMVFNRVTTGAQNDLKKITDLAYAQVQEFGMDDSIGLISFNREEVKSKRRKPFSKNLSALIDQQTRILLSDVYKTTESILRTHRNKLEILAENLLKSETLTCEQIEKLIGPPLFDKKRFTEDLESKFLTKQFLDE